MLNFDESRLLFVKISYNHFLFPVKTRGLNNGLILWPYPETISYFFIAYYILVSFTYAYSFLLMSIEEFPFDI